MQDSTLTSHKVLNTFMYGSPFCIIIYRSYKVSNMLPFLGLKLFWYFRCGIVSLNLRKEYLNVTTLKIPVLLQIKSWTFWYIERLPVLSYTGFTYFQIWSVFWPILYIMATRGYWWPKIPLFVKIHDGGRHLPYWISIFHHQWRHSRYIWWEDR